MNGRKLMKAKRPFFKFADDLGLIHPFVFPIEQKVHKMRWFFPKISAAFRPMSLFLTALFICLLSPGQPSPPMVTAVNDSQNLSAPLVSTTHGLLQGQTVEFDWGQADVFYGIPYARPPIGEFRFEVKKL